MDLPTQTILTDDRVSVRPDSGPGHLRIVKPTPPVPMPRRSWAGEIGNSLLEAPWLIWSLFDVTVLTFALYLAHQICVLTLGPAWIEFGWAQTWLVQTPAFVVAGLIFGLYEQKTLLRRSRIIARSVLAAVLGITLTCIAIYLLIYAVPSRRVLFLAGCLYLTIALPVRLVVGSCLNSYSRKFLIVGTDRKSRLSPANQGDALSRRYRLIGYVTPEPIEVGRRIDGHPVLGTVDDIERLCIERQIDEVVVGPAAAKNSWLVDKTLRCLRLGCRVTNLSTFYEEALSEVPAALLEPNWFLFADLKHYRQAQLIMKRSFDILAAIIGFVLALPAWPLIALLIKLDSAGPVFYSQVRVGLNGRHFRLYKFRTMKTSAEKDGHTWAALNDPRVTRVGRYLRKTRLDELPQLWNVLTGAMSIVGPRPERPEFVGELNEKIRFYNERHLIKPGLTGWAQINYRYGASVEDAQRKLQLDLWYIKHMSPELDLTILLRTFGILCQGSR